MIAGTPTTTNYTYNAANQITNTGFVYDANGNLLNDGQKEYAWNRANRLTQLADGSDIYDYKYDGSGSRTRQTVNSIVTNYLLDVQPGLVQVLAQSVGGNTTRFLHGPRGILSYENPDGEWGAVAQDGLGSVRMEVDNDLDVVASRNLTSIGVEWNVQGSFGLPHGFTGEMADANDLLYLRARYYAPEIGVFTALDPLELLNRYQYVGGNAINRTDPSGYIPNPDFDDYSCNCGWLDWHHIQKSEEKAYTLLDDVNYIYNRSTDDIEYFLGWIIEFQIQQRGGWHDIIEAFAFSGMAGISEETLNRIPPLALAYSIFLNGNFQFEEMQGDAANSLGIFDPGWGVSYFSEEDIPSDIIGFYIAHQRHLTGAESWQLYEDIKSSRLCNAVSRAESKQVFETDYGNGGGFQTGWTNQFPRLAPVTSCTCNNRSWPNAFRRYTYMYWPPALGVWNWIGDWDVHEELGSTERANVWSLSLANHPVSERPPEPPSFIGSSEPN
jgi:RHS repeat-associated protein